MSKKLFVIVDAFLDRSQQTVQACHAAAAYAQSPLNVEWRNTNIVIKKAKDIAHWFEHCDVPFYEPYWNDKLTAVAAYREEGFAEELPFV